MEELKALVARIKQTTSHHEFNILNCQGLGRALAVCNLRDMDAKVYPFVILLIETKMNG